MEHKQQKILTTLKKRQLLIIGIYRSPVVSIGDLCSAVRETLNSISTQFNVFMGDFSVNWLNDSQSTPLYNFFIRDNAYSQLVTGSSTTDSNTCIDHIFTTLPQEQVNSQILETCFSNHNAVWALLNWFN